MGNFNCHLKQAKHNEQLAHELAQPPIRYRDWVIIVLFYSAVHYVEAYFDRLGLHSNNHCEREEYIKRYLTTDYRFRANYKKLSENAWIARYLHQDVNSNANNIAHDYYSDQDIETFIKTLEEIKAWLRLS